MAATRKQQGVISGSITWNNKEYITIFDRNFRYLYGEVEDLFIAYGAWVEYDVVQAPANHPKNCYMKAINVNMDVKVSKAPTTDDFTKNHMNVRVFNKVDYFQYDGQSDGNLTHKSSIRRNFHSNIYSNEYYGEVTLARDAKNRLMSFNINEVDVMMTLIPSSRYSGTGPNWEVTHFVNEGTPYGINGFLSIRGFILRGRGGVVRNRRDVHIPPDSLRPASFNLVVNANNNRRSEQSPAEEMWDEPVRREPEPAIAKQKDAPRPASAPNAPTQKDSGLAPRPMSCAPPKQVTPEAPTIPRQADPAPTVDEIATDIATVIIKGKRLPMKFGGPASIPKLPAPIEVAPKKAAPEDVVAKPVAPEDVAAKPLAPEKVTPKPATLKEVDPKYVDPKEHSQKNSNPTLTPPKEIPSMKTAPKEIAPKELYPVVSMSNNSNSDFGRKSYEESLKKKAKEKENEAKKSSTGLASRGTGKFGASSGPGGNRSGRSSRLQGLGFGSKGGDTETRGFQMSFIDRPASAPQPSNPIFDVDEVWENGRRPPPKRPGFAQMRTGLAKYSEFEFY